MIFNAKKANFETIIAFLEYLQSQRRGAKILVIWDGASYQRSGQIKEYLDSLNAEAFKMKAILLAALVLYENIDWQIFSKIITNCPEEHKGPKNMDDFL
ncbi:MAG: hypothetical protein V7K77_13905 [Nostoc sp.]|uniref:hypothetical protein n=1 Tax=Nostoc sp. TaxID=1180 RepID=UPI002FF6E138